MAEKTDNATQEPKKKRLPIKTFLILAAVLAIEGATISAVFLLSGGPVDAKADGTALDEAALDQPVEILLVEDKFQNTRTGRSYLYDTELYILLAKRHELTVGPKIEAMRAQITTDIATIFRRAEPAHLHEPDLSTLTRQIQAVLDRHLGYTEEGKPLVQDVLIRKCIQLRADL